MRTAPYEEMVAIATAVAQQAGDLILKSRPHERVPAAKWRGRDFVTDVDIAVENFIVESIRTARRGDAILGEEGTQIKGGRFRWIIDPIDGTSNFIRGLPGFVTSIAVQDDEESIIGVVFDPVHQELFTAYRGSRAQCNGKALHVSATVDLGTALIGTGFSANNDRRSRQVATLRRFLSRAGDVRSFGVCAYDCCQVASGRLDAYYEAGLDLWDYAAGAFIAKQAGAEILLSPEVEMTGDMLAVATPGIFAEVDNILKNAPDFG